MLWLMTASESRVAIRLYWAIPSSNRLDAARLVSSLPAIKRSRIMTGEKLQQLAGRTVVVIGGSSGIGFETARRARAEGADVLLTARDPDRLRRVGLELGASTAAFDATDFERLGRFFGELPRPIDHALVTGTAPSHTPL